MKTNLLILVTSCSLLIAGHAANTILVGTDPIEETGGPDGWDGIAVMTTPIAGPPGETVGIVSTFNFYADPGRVDPVGLVTPLIVKESGGTYTVAAVGKQIEVTEGGIQSVPFEIAEGSEVVELAGGDNFHVGIAQERFEGANDANGGVIPFAGEGGKGMFYFNTEPPHEAKVGDEVSAGHESPEGGRLYQFNFEIEFSDDDPNALLPRSFDLGQIASFPPVQDFSIDIRNSGENNDLLVESVTVTGGPQAANFSVVDFSKTVGPRGEGEIQMQVDSKGGTGLFQATVEVKSNDESVEDQVIAFEVSASVINTAAPASRLTLDEAAGSTDLVDVTGNNRHGVVNAFDGTATLGEPGLDAQTGTAMKVSGGGGAGIPGNVFEESFGEFAVAMWVNPAALGSLADQTFGTLVGMGQANPLFGLLSADGQLLWFGEVDGTADVIFGSETAPFKVDTLHHVVMTRSDERASIYVNGEEVAGLDDPPAVGDTKEGTLFVGGFNGALGFDGVIDDVQIYERAVLVEDVAFLFNNPGKDLGDTGGVPDSDGDGLDDEREAELGTEPLVADTDDDGLSDGEEVDTHNTNPLSDDTDGDGYRDALEIAQNFDPLDPNVPGGGPPVRAGDPNNPLIARTSVDGWNSVMVIDEARPFDFASVGATSGVVGSFEFWVGAAVGRVTPFIAERTADNEFIVKAIGTTRVAGEDYSEEATAVSFAFDDDNSNVEVQDGWVPGFTVADPDGSNVEGAVIPFDGGGGDMWLAGGPAPEESASIALGEAPNTETTNTVFNDSLDRLYAFAIMAEAELEQGYADTVLSDNPIAYWQFEDSATATDSVGTTNGTYNGITFEPGVSGQAARWNTADLPDNPGSSNIDFGSFGVGALAQLTNIDNPADDPNFDANKQTSLEFWVKTSQVSGNGNNWRSPVVFGEESPGDGDIQWGWITDAGEVGFAVNDASGGTFRGPVINDDAWHHIVQTFDFASGEHVTYVDGAAAITETSAGNNVQDGDTGNEEARIRYMGWNSRLDAGAGAASPHLLGQFEGLLDEVAIYNAVLSADQVTAHYSAGSGGGDTGGTGTRAPEITGVSISAAGVALQLPAGTTYDIEFSTDLVTWTEIATGVTGTYSDSDAARVGGLAGYYRGVVK